MESRITIFEKENQYYFPTKKYLKSTKDLKKKKV